MFVFRNRHSGLSVWCKLTPNWQSESFKNHEKHVKTRQTNIVGQSIVLSIKVDGFFIQFPKDSNHVARTSIVCSRQDMSVTSMKTWFQGKLPSGSTLQVANHMNLRPCGLANAMKQGNIICDFAIFDMSLSHKSIHEVSIRGIKTWILVASRCYLDKRKHSQPSGSCQQRGSLYMHWGLWALLLLLAMSFG